MLKDTIRRMLEYGQNHPGEAVRQRLGKGLEVAVKVNGNEISLQLGRNDVFPSTLEWKTVLSHWPEPLMVAQEPKGIKSGSSYFLQGKLRRNLTMMAGSDGTRNHD